MGEKVRFQLRLCTERRSTGSAAIASRVGGTHQASRPKLVRSAARLRA
jgi:hypothetical protein